MNLWILTEERPKKAVIEQLVRLFAEEKKLHVEVDNVQTIPITKKRKNISLFANKRRNVFTFAYKVAGMFVNSISEIFLKTVSGASSFVDFMIFLQEDEPTEDSSPLYAIEETKTSDIESRNTGVYQRCSKFVFADFYYPDSKKIMLYNIQIDMEGQPTETNIFGTRMLLSVGVEILGKTLDETVFKPFRSIDELITFKNNMRKPPSGNVPIEIKKFGDRIEVSGRLYKAGYLAHDPNIGALSLISKTLRVLGWNKDIVITRHGLSQEHVTSRNKFVRIAEKLQVKLDGLALPHTTLPKKYWHYEEKSEKVATIFLHLILQEADGVSVIYENHAGCERGYFVTKSGKPIAIHKYIENDKSKGVIRLPDLIVRDDRRRLILVLEGKKWNKVTEGINNLEEFGPIEKEYIRRYYSEYSITRHVVLFGGSSRRIDKPEVAFLLNSRGEMITSPHTPEVIKDAIKNLCELPPFKKGGFQR